MYYGGQNIFDLSLSVHDYHAEGALKALGTYRVV